MRPARRACASTRLQHRVAQHALGIIGEDDDIGVAQAPRRNAAARSAAVGSSIGAVVSSSSRSNWCTPTMKRVLAVVGRPGATTSCGAMPLRCASSRASSAPAASSPITPTSATWPPSVATFSATLAAPPSVARLARRPQHRDRRLRRQAARAAADIAVEHHIAEHQHPRVGEAADRSAPVRVSPTADRQRPSTMSSRLRQPLHVRGLWAGYRDRYPCGVNAAQRIAIFAEPRKSQGSHRNRLAVTLRRCHIARPNCQCRSQEAP